MYLTIIFLPLLSAIISSLTARSIGTKGSKILSCLIIILTAILITISFYEVGFQASTCSIILFNWLDLESLQLSWSFQLDSLTVSMLLPVIYVSSCVHLYSVGYMENDAHVPRFFSYLSLFTFFMILLVTANNFLILFIGWEGVGICSYLLINFWFRRLQANKAAIQAILVNKVGDLGFSLGLFFMFLTFGNLDFSTIFSMTPIINHEVVSIICLLLLIGAMAKSAQMPLHIWLPSAMEGSACIVFIFIYFTFYFEINDSYWESVILSGIWVYNVNTNSLVEGALFKSKAECSRIIPIHSRIIASYLDKDLAFKSTWVFSSSPLNLESLAKYCISSALWETLVGNLLGDGSLIKTSNSHNYRIKFTFTSKQIEYIKYLKEIIYAPICTLSPPTPYPNKPGIEPTQYWFGTRSLSSIT